jgi:asparagine synthase (glutamine-hydrolysing)
MCGIAGIFAPEATSRDSSEERAATLRGMLGLIRHRGPDDVGHYADESIALGAVRLAILDIEGGSQPLCDPTGRYWISYNGEVYNYIELRRELESKGRRFATSTDTEVVLQAWIAWGEDALPRLNGGFAFAIYDRLERQLVLVRDRFGKRPLFYTQSGQRLLFCSEMKGLLADDRVEFAFDPAQLASIFRCWTPIDDQTGYRGIRQLRPGHFLRAGRNVCEVRPFAGVDLAAAPFEGSREAARERTREMLAESVRLRLRSDVEVGTYLSGGIDSAIVTHLAVQQLGRRVKTFSIAFDDESYDESQVQERLRRDLNTEHFALRLDEQAIADLVPDAVWHAEIPVFRTALAPMYALAREVRRQGIKVVLTGEGADEAFLGYDLFKETLLRARWESLTDDGARAEEISRLYPYLTSFGPEKVKPLLGHFHRLARPAGEDLFAYDLRFNMSAFALRLLADGHEVNGHAGKWALEQAIESQRCTYRKLPVVRRAQWLEYKTLLAGYLLSSQGDRMALAYGVENRCPFLDYNLVDWAASLPDEWKLTAGGDEKRILRDAFAAELPAYIVERRKQPYRAPDFARWLFAARPDWMELLLSGNELSRIDVLDAKFCGRFLETLGQALRRGSAVSPRDSHALMLLVSTALLHHAFVQRNHRWTAISKEEFRHADRKPSAA